MLTPGTEAYDSHDVSDPGGPAHPGALVGTRAESTPWGRGPREVPVTTLVHWDRMHSASPAARSTFTAQTPAVDPTMPGRRIDVIADNPNVSKGVVGAQGYLLPADAQTLDQVAAQSSVGG